MENFVKENKGPDFTEAQTYVQCHEGEAKKTTQTNKTQVNTCTLFIISNSFNMTKALQGQTVNCKQYVVLHKIAFGTTTIMHTYCKFCFAV